MSFDKNWVATEEGNREFVFWVCDLAEKAKKSCGIPMEVDKNGNILVTVELEDEDYPKSLRKTKEFNKLPKATKIAMEVREPLLEMLTNVATTRQSAHDKGVELNYTDDELFEKIEDLVMKYLITSSQKAKEKAVDILASVENFEIEKTDFGYNIIPVEKAKDEKFGSKLKKVFTKIKNFFVDYFPEIFGSLYILICTFLIFIFIKAFFV